MIRLWTHRVFSYLWSDCENVQRSLIYDQTMKMKVCYLKSVGWFIWYLTPHSTAMVISGRSVHLITLFLHFFLAQPWLSGKLVLHAHTFDCNWQNPSWNSGRVENGRRNYFMIHSHESNEPNWDLLTTHGSAVRHVSAVRHATDCEM